MFGGRHRRCGPPLLRKRSGMSIVDWLLLGLIAGIVTSKLYAESGYGVVFDMALGVVGIEVGDFLFECFGGDEAAGLNLYGIVVATIGTLAVRWLLHAVQNHRHVEPFEQSSFFLDNLHDEPFAGTGQRFAPKPCRLIFHGDGHP